MVSNVIKDAVVSVLDKGMNCEEELDVLEGVSDIKSVMFLDIGSREKTGGVSADGIVM
jgi:hypothetical protein